MRHLWLMGVLAALSLSCQSSTLTAAKLYLQQERSQEAKEQLQKALETEPQNPEVHFLLGKIYAEEGQYQAMDAAFDRSTELSPKFGAEIEQLRHHYWVREYNTGVGYAGGDGADFHRALRAFRSASIIDEARLESWRNLAYVYYQVDSTNAAIAAYQKIMTLAPTDTASQYSLGVLYLNQKRYEEAAGALARLVELNPDHLDGHINLAVAHVHLGHLDKAEEFYRRAIAIDPMASHPYYNLGNLYWQMEKYEAAREAYKKAVELKPDDYDALYNLAVTHLSLEDLDGALPLLERLSEVMPDNASVWRELGRVYAHKGRVEESKRAYAREQALVGSP